jgi:hypothetical protein
MPNGSSGSGGGIGLGGVAAAFGGERGPPREVFTRGSWPLLTSVRGTARDVSDYTRRALPGFFADYERGTAQQRGFQGEQEGVLRDILARRSASDPEALLQRTGNTLFGFIQPNVLDPLGRADVNRDIVMRRARGLNPGAIDSTAERLRNARIASGRYYDVARNVYAQLPQVYQQLRDAGVADEALMAGVFPQIQQGYRALDYAPLSAIQGGQQATLGGIGLAAAYGPAARANVYGYHQPTNNWDRAGDASRAVSNTIQQAADIYSSLYGGGKGPIAQYVGGGAGTGGGTGGGGGGGGGGINIQQILQLLQGLRS